jgi:hypothetical protein
MFMNVGGNNMPNENTPTLVFNFLHSGTRIQQTQELTDVGVMAAPHILQLSMVHATGKGKGKGKGKAIPLQAWTDPEGSRRLRLPDFKTIGT